MIALDALITYHLMPNRSPKLVVALLLLAALSLRRTKLMERLYLKFNRISIRPVLFSILAAAFLARLFWVLWSPHVPPAPISEDWHVVKHARDLAAGAGFINVKGEFSAQRPIGYPLFLSFLFRVFGNNLLVPELFQVLFGVASVFLVFYLGKQLVSHPFGLIAAALYAFYPTAIMATKIIIDEHPFLLLWLGGLVLLVSDYQRPALWKIVSAGVLVGVSGVCRTYSVITWGVAFTVWFLARRPFTEAFTRGAVLALLVVLCALPWGIRNYYRLGTPILWTSAIGMNLYFGNNPTSDVRYPVNPDLEHGGDPDYLKPNLTEVQRDRAGRRAAFRWITENPGIFLQKAVGRVFYMLGLNSEGWVIDDNFVTIKEGAKRPSKRVLRFFEKYEKYYYAYVYLLGVVGILSFFANVASGGDSKGMAYIVTTLAFYLVVIAVSLGHRKYRFAIEPFFCILATYGTFEAFFGAAVRKLQDQGS